MPRAFISLTSDFGVQTQGVGAMEGAIRAIAPEANVVHLMHGLPSFDIIAAARTMETVLYLPKGAHVCVCDPGVGSARKAVIIEVKRGDFLVGPDNGVLIPATRTLDGITRVHEITNQKYMRLPVSPIFHGRDIFAPAAAHLSNGVSIEEFGPPVKMTGLVAAAYEEAVAQGRKILASVIQINKFGSLHLNIKHELWNSFGLKEGATVTLASDLFLPVKLTFGRTFSDVPAQSNVILKDDYGRIEIAKNLGSFVEEHAFKIGDDVTVEIGS
jgi:S-adenosylmethionine hydrolase